MTSFTDSASHLTTSYGWDSRGELKTVTLPTKKSVTYLRDVAGNPSVRSSGGVITVWNVFNHRNQLIATLDPALGAAVSKRFVYGTNPSVPDYMFVPSTGHTFKFVTDHLGSPVEIIDVNTGAVAEEIHYDDFGNVTSDSNPGFQPFGFAGCLYDIETKLCQFGARQYDPSIGRWLTKDPILFDGGDTNLYGYVVQDPINFIDPTGLIKYTPTAGGTVDGKTTAALSCFETCAGGEVTVTGGMEGGHASGSAHGTGEACDLGKNSNPSLTRDTAQRCFTQCFDQSTSYGQEEGNHFHMQTRPGRGGATGGFPPGTR